MQRSTSIDSSRALRSIDLFTRLDAIYHQLVSNIQKKTNLTADGGKSKVNFSSLTKKKTQHSFGNFVQNFARQGVICIERSIVAVESMLRNRVVAAWHVSDDCRAARAPAARAPRRHTRILYRRLINKLQICELP